MVEAHKRLPVFYLAAMIAATMAAWPASAKAHAVPSAMQPAAGSTATVSLNQVVIEFDSPIEAMFARVEVIDGKNADHVSDKPSVGSDQRSLTVPVKQLQPGQYTVKWSVVGKDSHRTHGSYTFTIVNSGS